MSVRPAAVAGMFYPDHADELSQFINNSVATAENATGKLIIGCPKAVIVPHAGYIYSGLTAAFAYAAVKSTAIRRVLLFGPAHRVPFYGMALPECDVFETPLGRIELDQESMTAALELPHVCLNDQAHAREHSLEVQLPFLQIVLNDIQLIPLCVGMVEPEAVAEVMSALWGGDDTLVVISSDLSHFHAYQEARAIDEKSIETVLAKTDDLSHDQACGATAINALQQIAREKHMSLKLLDYRNSGDTAGDKDRVVGYASIGCYEHRSAHE
ncbi:MEMO1 family protein [Mariprofundus micogutta]|uniref:MEMO1 family protein MMIC_P2050 n=1 Tax=Mariprofundus micogutta TaxID=1921010 RepID=A0A1L8CQ82_9PROT|nr:AmmeMemoRadiSam system protein B [Mariprofundus micogutta]GAV21071.1 MEMO1 family protein [Mariprofundus micogutta]